MHGWFVAWKDGWRYFTLYGWAPEARADAGMAAFDRLVTELRFTPLGTLYRKMSPRDLERFESYQRRVRQDEALSPAEDAEMARLMKANTGRLPEESFRRLQALFEKAIALGALLERSG